MGIDLFWDDTEQTVFLAEFNGKWTWDELHAMFSTIQEISQQRQQIFGAIIDVSRGLHLPGGSIFNAEALNNFRRMLMMNDGSQKGPMVIVGLHDMIRTIFDTAAKIDRKATQDIHFADSMDAARTIIYPLMAQLQQHNRSSA